MAREEDDVACMGFYDNAKLQREFRLQRYLGVQLGLACTSSLVDHAGA